MPPVRFSAEETLRRRTNELKIQEKLECLQTAVENEDENTEDEDVKMLLTKAQEIKVDGPTLSLDSSPLEIFHPSRGLMFDEGTLISEILFENGTSRLKKIFMRKNSFRHFLQTNALQVMSLNKTDKASLLLYLFYTMSVHQDYKVAEHSFSNLVKSDFQPSFSDLVNIFLNWGANFNDLFCTQPEEYCGLPTVLTRCQPLGQEVFQHNMHYVFLYLKHVVESMGGSKYLSLIGPLSRMMFDAKILEFGLKNILKLTIQAIATSGVPPLTSIHMSDMSFRTRTVLCADALEQTRVGPCLAYVVLQLFLGEPTVRYGSDICLEHILELYLSRKEVVMNASCLDLYCFLRLLLSCIEAVRDSADQALLQKIYKELISTVSRNFVSSQKSCDPTLIKEQLSRIEYYWNVSQEQWLLLRNCRSLSCIEATADGGAASSDDSSDSVMR